MAEKSITFIKVPEGNEADAGGKVVRLIDIKGGGEIAEVWVEGKGWTRNPNLTFGDIWREVEISEEEAKTLMT